MAGSRKAMNDNTLGRRPARRLREERRRGAADSESPAKDLLRRCWALLGGALRRAYKPWAIAPPCEMRIAREDATFAVGDEVGAPGAAAVAPRGSSCGTRGDAARRQLTRAAAADGPQAGAASWIAKEGGWSATPGHCRQTALGRRLCAFGFWCPISRPERGPQASPGAAGGG
ncbi:hypothetical protein Rsub_02503 [Raphidocelis subcapitata]|uniref:Uncharacterized protein n=1 Tax=Raphidocelis subcapitata TaxID=307507 RepID=A0A2V0NZP9_9CHLO|nr:hypothetical protein Rsub_02503 [Raphidocelis subcapitata]|eukprot:GBF90397.1 hypothetical protein Rsub_02503 [Raphidocelis subcapitata]